MPMDLKGSCRCGAVSFTLASHTPAPYQLCYCSICRKQAGGGGYAINLGADAHTLKVQGRGAIGVFRARIHDDEHATSITSSGERNFCTRCGAALWLFDPNWPDLIHPFASAIDSDLPAPPSRVHLMLKYKAQWVAPDIREGDESYQLYPRFSIAEWHKRNGMWV